MTEEIVHLGQYWHVPGSARELMGELIAKIRTVEATASGTEVHVELCIEPDYGYDQKVWLKLTPG